MPDSVSATEIDELRSSVRTALNALSSSADVRRNMATASGWSPRPGAGSVPSWV